MLMMKSDEQAPPHEQVAFNKLKKQFPGKLKYLGQFGESDLGNSYDQTLQKTLIRI